MKKQLLCRGSLLLAIVFMSAFSTPVVFGQGFDYGSYTLLRNYDFGTSSTSTVKNLTDLSASFKPYGIAQTTVINNEWQVYQTFNSTNHHFTTDALELTADDNLGGVFKGGISSGQIVTKETFYPRDGKTYVFVVRAKIPKGDGLWPAFWMYAQADPHTSSEIDIFEFFDSPTQDTHDWTGFDHGSGVGSYYYNIMTNQWVWHPGFDFADAFHEYVLVWKEGDIQKWVDGTQVTGRFFDWFGSDPEVIINLAVGGDPNNAPTTTGTPWPSKFIVDYLRIYVDDGQTQPVGLPANPVRLIARHSGMSLNVEGASLSNGANVTQRSYTGAVNQQWNIEDAGSGYYKLINVNSGKALDVQDASLADGGNVQQWEFDGTSHKLWSIEDAGDGYFKLINAHSGKALDVQDASLSEGGNVQQWQYDGTTHKQWRIVTAEDVATTTVTVNQQQNGGVWNSIGTYDFVSGSSGFVRIRTNNTNGFVIADGVKFSKAGQADIILDSEGGNGVTVTGTWTSSTFYPDFIGTGYRHDGNTGKGTKSVTFTPNLPVEGEWTVSLYWNAFSDRASNVPVDVMHAADPPSGRLSASGEGDKITAKGNGEELTAMRMSSGDERQGEQVMNIYPNPLNASDLMLEYNGDPDNRTFVRVLSLSGQEMFNAQFHDRRMSIARRTFQPGIFIVQIESNGHVCSRYKLVVH